MKLFICTDHPGVWPVGTASIVIAPTEELARNLLDRELTKRNLDGSYSLTEVSTEKAQAIILRDGDY